ncbi:hypothetical protein C8F04DRAFT_961456, partial [Mycena alexandri]
NMVEIVWKTLEDYQLKDCVLGIMMDNASNNDTLVAAIEQKCLEKNIKFSAQISRLRCMPHTVHLAVLQAIGAVEKSKKTRASPYQESVTVPPDTEDIDEAEEAIVIDDREEDGAALIPHGI